MEALGIKAWGPARKILCVRLDSLGDVLMTTPALRALKESSPGRAISLLTSSQGAEAARLVPEVDEVLVYNAPWMKAAPPREGAGPDRATVDYLRSRGLEGAVIFTVYSQSPLPAALLCYLADIPLRLAYCRENPYQLLTSWLPEREPEHLGRHEVKRHLDLVSHIGAAAADERLSLRVPDDERSRVDHLLEGMGIGPDRSFVAIHPGATAPSRRWPAEGFAAVARALMEEMGLPVVFTGNEEERVLAGTVMLRAGGGHCLAGSLSLAGLGALLSQSSLLISNNTGPVHVAAAVGTPVVCLYALTNPQHHPWSVPCRVLSHDVPCKYCYKSVCPLGSNECLSRVGPREVVAAASELLAESPRRPKPGAGRENKPPVRRRLTSLHVYPRH